MFVCVCVCVWKPDIYTSTHNMYGYNYDYNNTTVLQPFTIPHQQDSLVMVLLIVDNPIIKKAEYKIEYFIAIQSLTPESFNTKCRT